jgi:hypothetical protein
VNLEPGTDPFRSYAVKGYLIKDREGREGFFSIPRLPAWSFQRVKERVKPAGNQGGLASPLRCSRSSLKTVKILRAKAALARFESSFASHW